MIFKDLSKISEEIKKLKNEWKKIVRTNWCFDIIHPWHIENFRQAKILWDILVVWINWDKSPYFVTKPGRPINNEIFRSEMLDAVKYIDYLYIFDEETPYLPISNILPNVLIKWWDYNIDTIVWAKEVIANWWEVILVPTVWDWSTSNIVKKILETYGTGIGLN